MTVFAPRAQRVLDIVDSMDTLALAELYAPDATLVFGNGVPMSGRAEIATGLSDFFATIAGLHHQIVNEWTVGDTTIVELMVAYDRLDGNRTSVPVVSIWAVRPDGLISTYRVFFDLAPVFAPLPS